MIYRVLHEFNISDDIDGFKINLSDEFNISDDIDGFKINLSDERLGHDRRIKIVGKGVTKGKSTSIPVHRQVLNFDELMDDKHTVRSGESGKYLEFVVGFVVMNHYKLLDYFNSIDSNTGDKDYFKSEINKAFRLYKKKYKPNDIAKIRRDANSHARFMKLGL